MKNDITTLLALIKRDQDLTWTDTATDEKLTEIVEDAIVQLTDKLGNDAIDFTKPGPDRMLFKNYCMYARNKMLEEFETAYSKEIIQRRHYYAVMRRMGQHASE